MNNEPVAVKAVGELVSLLKLCQPLQSKQDGRERPKSGAHSHDEGAFAYRIRSTSGQALLLRRLLPVTTPLSTIGAEMEHLGEIRVLPGEDYAQKALECLKAEYLPEEEDAP